MALRADLPRENLSSLICLHFATFFSCTYIINMGSSEFPQKMWAGSVQPF